VDAKPPASLETDLTVRPRKLRIHTVHIRTQVRREAQRRSAALMILLRPNGATTSLDQQSQQPTNQWSAAPELALQLQERGGREPSE